MDQEQVETLEAKKYIKKLSRKIWQRLDKEICEWSGQWDYVVQELRDECKEKAFRKMMRSIIEEAIIE